MEKKNFTKDVIEAFYNAETSKRFQQLFQKWFLANRNLNEQNKALYSLWEQSDNTKETSTEDELEEVNYRIDMLSRKQKRTASWLKVASIIILPFFVAGLTFYLTKDKYSGENLMTQYYVGRGDVKHITLADGTTVWINSESTLIYPEKFDKDKRVVYLVGEANFHVTKSAEKPFIVQTSKMSIKVLGTKFNVEAYPDASEIVTTLEEGKIMVNINDEHENSFYMSPNEEVALNVTTESVTKRIVDASDANAWDKGILAFSGASLEYIFRQIERKYDIKVNYNLNSYYTNQRLTIRFGANDSVEDIFGILQNMVSGLHIKIANDEVEVN